MLFKWMTKTFRKLFGLKNVEEDKRKKIHELTEAFEKGEISHDAFAEAFDEMLGFPREEKIPLRPGEPFECIKDEMEGYARDPDAFKLTMRVVGTDQYVGLRIVKHEGDWWYELDKAHMVTLDGKKIPGEKGKLPKDIRDKLCAKYGHADLKNAPAPSYG